MAQRIECPSDHTLAEYIEGKLPIRAAVSVVAHVVVCRECKEVVEAVRASTAACPVEG